MTDARDLAPVTPVSGELTIEISDAPSEIPQDIADATEHRWAQLLAKNPRHFDGPILAIESFDPDTNSIRARCEGYKRLAVQPEADTGVRILSVTGFITALDKNNQPCVLIARRSEQTRVHGGLWELAPSGGIDPPGQASSLTLDHVRAQLATEMREELGLELDASVARPVALVVEDAGFSVDIVLRLDTNAPIESLGVNTDSWEYTGARWIPLDEAVRSAGQSSDELIPSTRNMLRSID